MTKVVNGTSELRWVFLFLLAFILFNIVTATSYPFPDIDEVMIAEPAVNFVHGKGFGIRFSEILAMYSFLLVPWFKLFGTSLRSIRSAEIVCTSTALFVLWSAVKRLGIVTSVSSRLLLLLLLATEYGMIFAYRDGRYDGFGALLIAVFLWLMSIKEKRLRILSLCAVSLFVPWAGFQYPPVLLTAGIALLLLFRWTYWIEVVASFLASAVGGGIFLAVVYASGRLSSLLKFLSIQQRGVIYISNWIKTGKLVDHNYIPKDLSFPFLVIAAAILFIFLLRNRLITSRSALAFAISFSVLLTVLLLVIAKFPTYYSYMIVIPISVSICSGLSMCRPGMVKTAVLMLCGLSAVAGAGLNAAAYAGDSQDHKYSQLEKFIGQAVHPDDIAYVDYAGYPPARQRARDAYLPSVDWAIIPLMSQEQKASITVLVVDPINAEQDIKDLGGQWQETGERLAPTGRSIFGDRKMGFLTLRPIDLLVLRRR